MSLESALALLESVSTRRVLLVGETIQDTLNDLAVYSIILRIWEDFRNEART